MGYPYLLNATYTNLSRRPSFSSTDQPDNKYQARRSNIPGQNNNYSNVIQNHALKDHQFLVSGALDHKPITILIDTGSSITILLVVHCPTTATYIVFSFRGNSPVIPDYLFSDTHQPLYQYQSYQQCIHTTHTCLHTIPPPSPHNCNPQPSLSCH